MCISSALNSIPGPSFVRMRRRYHVFRQLRRQCTWFFFHCRQRTFQRKPTILFYSCNTNEVTNVLMYTASDEKFFFWKKIYAKRVVTSRSLRHQPVWKYETYLPDTELVTNTERIRLFTRFKNNFVAMRMLFF